MKKLRSPILAGVLIIALLLTACHAAKGVGMAPENGTPTPVKDTPSTAEVLKDATTTELLAVSAYPEDMIPAVITFGSFSLKEGKAKLTVTVDGYRSDSLGLDFFLLYDEPIRLRATVKNEYRTALNCTCREAEAPDGLFRHNHEISFSLADESGNPLTRVMPSEGCIDRIDKYSIPARGGTKSFEYLFAAGAIKEPFSREGMKAKDPAKAVFADNVSLYPPECYTQKGAYLTDTFRGEFSFDYYDPYLDSGSCHVEYIEAKTMVTLTVLRPAITE